ncbi:hypothetical protein [Mucilaginibacter sp.]|uniref:hypothetical protein n=1 Tax=Mucilaginibacter sp. TaxID=1882438 RepID=UPI002611CC65|nr:hypothetical protein [Mucilaginibacter sp.]MDB4921225.1 hypothetical protein [Mucilaginibacter sp.]
MAQPTIHTHTYQHFENLQLSAKDFYTQLHSLITEYQFPEVTCRVTPLSDNGSFFSRREYLEIKYHSFKYYVCAAPFGKNFFISWRLQEYVSTWTRFSNWIEGKKGKSFYEQDTEVMFSNSITALVKNVVGKVMEEHGFRQPDAIVLH